MVVSLPRRGGCSRGRRRGGEARVSLRRRAAINAQAKAGSVAAGTLRGGRDVRKRKDQERERPDGDWD